MINQLQIRFNWKIAFVIVLSLIVLLKLGFWQLSRAEQKRQMQAEYQQRQHAIPIPIESLITENKQTLNYQRVRLKGRYLNHKSFYVSNKLYQGRLGYEVITPFKLKSSDQIVLVSRGWKPVPYQQKQLPAVDLISGEQELIGAIHLATGKSFFLAEKLEGKKWPIRLHHFQIDTIAEAELFQTPIMPYVVRLEPGNPGALQAFWPVISFNPGGNTAYAIQWFMMTLAVLVITIIKSTNIVQLMRWKQ